MRHETAIFGPKNPNPEIPVIIFFLPTFFSFNNKKLKHLLKPLFYSVLANLKREFLNFKLETQKIEKPNFCTLFLKSVILENCQIIGHKKPQNDN